MCARFAREFRSVAGEVSWRGQKGRAIILSGSCSTATRAQVTAHAAQHPTREIEAKDVIEVRLGAQEGVPLAYSSADPNVVKEVQAKFGQERSAQALEAFFAQVARLCVAAGVTRVITAGGETSGAVGESLAPERLEISPESDPGVPALRASETLTLALKSGNFGAEDFFAKAAAVLEGHDGHAASRADMLARQISV